MTQTIHVDELANQLRNKRIIGDQICFCFAYPSSYTPEIMHPFEIEQS